MIMRIRWLDTARFLAILLVYLFHIGRNTGYMHSFSIQICIHLFFLISGFSEHLSKTDTWDECLTKNIRKLLIPYLLFAVLSVALNSILHNSYTTIVPDVLWVLKGVPRNWFCAVSLWFLTCLFIIRLAFFALRKYFKKPLHMLVVSFLLYVAGDSFVNRGHWLLSIFNIDNALYFLLFYVIGYLSFIKVRSLMDWNTFRKKIVFFCIAAMSALYTILIFFGKKPLHDLFNFNHYVLLLIEIIHPLILCAFALAIAKLIEDIDLFQKLGQETLYLCGTEFFTNSFLTAIILYFGVMPNYINTFAPYIYAMALLMTGHHIFVPFVKSILKKLGC